MAWRRLPALLMPDAGFVLLSFLQPSNALCTLPVETRLYNTHLSYRLSAIAVFDSTQLQDAASRFSTNFTLFGSGGSQACHTCTAGKVHLARFSAAVPTLP